MKFQDMPLELLKKELMLRTLKSDAPGYVEKDEYGELKSIREEIKKREDYYQEVPEFLRSEIGALFSGSLQGVSADFADEAIGMMSKESQQNYRTFINMMKEKYPKSYFVGDMAGMLGQAYMTAGLGSAIAGTSKVAPILNNIKKGVDSLGKGSAAFQKAVPFIAEHGINATHGGAIAALTGIGQGYDAETRYENAKELGIPAFLLGGVFSYGGKQVGKMIGAQSMQKEMRNLSKNLGIEDKKSLEQFLTILNPGDANVEKAMDKFRNMGLTRKGIGPEEAQKRLKTGIRDLLDSRDSDIKGVIEERFKDAPWFQKIINKPQEVAKVNSDIVKRAYQRKMPFWDDEAEKMVNDIWKTIEPDNWSDSRNPIDFARKFAKDEGQQSFQFGASSGRKYDLANGPGSFSLTPSHFSEADKKFNVKFREMFDIPYVQRDANVIRRSNTAREVKKAGDEILNDYKGTFSEIFPDWVANDADDTFFKEYGKIYNENDGLLNKLISVSDNSKKGNVKKIVDRVESIKSAAEPIVSSTLGGLGGYALASNPLGAIAGAGLGYGLPKLSRAGMKTLRENPEILQTPFSPLAAEKIWGPETNMTEEDQKTLEQFYKEVNKGDHAPDLDEQAIKDVESQGFDVEWLKNNL